jgi:hypothetical protein
MKYGGGRNTNGMDSAYLKVYHRICIYKPWKILNTHNTNNKDKNKNKRQKKSMSRAF